MPKLFDLRRVSVGPANLDAHLEVLSGAPYFTGDDPDGTNRILSLMPELAEHLCLGDVSNRFGAVADDTELAHMLEHVTVELVARTGLGSDIESGRTTRVGKNSFVVRLACPDDVLVCGALSSAVWILEWAYSGGGDPEPDIEAIVEGLRELVASVSEPEFEPEPEPVPEPEPLAEAAAEPVHEPEPLAEPAAESVPELSLVEEPEPESVAAPLFDEVPEFESEEEPAFDPGSDPESDIFADWPEPDPEAEAALEAEIDMILSSDFIGTNDNETGDL